MELTRVYAWEQAIECIPVEQQAAFVREIEGDVMRCVKDANGNHVSMFALRFRTTCLTSLKVIQKIIERVPPDLLEFVTVFQGNVYDLATHPYGCRVLQRCFEYLHDSQTRPLIDELHKYTTQLMQDQFGVSVYRLAVLIPSDIVSTELRDSVCVGAWGNRRPRVDLAQAPRPNGTDGEAQVCVQRVRKSTRHG